MYLGNNLQAAYSSYLLIDSLSASFNGTTTSFALKVNGVAPVPFPLNEQNVLISVGGVPQKPDPTGAEGFKFSGTNIVFSSAPKTGEAFWGVVLAGADYVNVGVSYPDGAATTPSITFNSNKTTGIYLAGVSTLGFTTAGVLRSTIDSNGNFSVLSAGSATIPAVAVGTGTTYAPGIYSPGADQLAISTNGTGRVFVTSAGNVGIGTTSPAQKLEVVDGSISVGSSTNTSATNVLIAGYGYNLSGTRIGNVSIRSTYNNANNSAGLEFYVDANGSSTTERARIDASGRVGIGTTSPAETLHLGGTSGQVMRINGVDTAAYFGAPATNIVQIASNRSPLTGTRVDGTRGASFISLNATTGGGSIDFATASGAADASTKATIDTSGRLLVGTSSNSGGAICQVAGSVQAANTFRFPANTKNGATCRPTAIETISTDGGTNTATVYGNNRYGAGKWVLLAAFDSSGNAVSATTAVGGSNITFVFCITDAATNFPTT